MQLTIFIQILKPNILMGDKSFFLCQSPSFQLAGSSLLSLWVPISFVCSVLDPSLWYSPCKNLQKYLEWSFIFRNWTIFVSAEKNLVDKEDLVHFLEAFIKLSSFCHFKSVLWNRVSRYSGGNYSFLITTWFCELLVLVLNWILSGVI